MLLVYISADIQVQKHDGYGCCVNMCKNFCKMIQICMV